jgi:ATP-dependent exoDNAse (exonuclease V) beta subunit
VIVADAGRDRVPPSPDEILALPDGRFGFRVADPATAKRRGAFDYDEVREARQEADQAERLRLYYVAMTRAKERLIVSGSVDFGKASEAPTPIAWVLERLRADEELAAAGDAPLELAREEARLLVRVDRYREEGAPVEAPAVEAEPEEGQLALFAGLEELDAALPPAPRLPELIAIPPPPLLRVRRLSFTALSTFEQCSYKYWARYGLGMAEQELPPGEGGMSGVEVGSRVHELLEHIDLAAPVVPEIEDERIRALVAAYCQSELAARVGALAGVTKERHFTFEQDGVLVHGFLDVFHLADGRAVVVDYKTNLIGDSSPEEIVEADYRLQRLVYALACFRAGAQEVEVVYQFLERPDAPVIAVFSREDEAALATELSEAIARIQAGEFRPTPSEFACAGCPALDLVCAGPRLRRPPAELVAS